VAGLPNRRTFYLIVITGALMQPAGAMVRIWLRKHLATSATPSTRTAAAVAEQVL
jgi:hypothetical protein